jgi:uncharacterized membrane protein YedE/YeeE
MNAYWPSLLGGMLLGLSAVLLLLLNGRVAGISGIVGGLLQVQNSTENLAFVAGLFLGPLTFAMIFGAAPIVTINASWSIVILAGLLVGFGVRMGSGCTSGHGIIGLARLSPRSIAATGAFLTVGIVTATLMGAFR